MQNYIKRFLEKPIAESARYFSVITVTGPRQSGKSTLLRHLFPNALYRSLENPDTRRAAREDPRGFLTPQNEEMIIDEVQRYPDLLSYIQGIVDEKGSRKFYLTGSSNFALMKSITQSLAGRTAVLELLPLQLGELPDSEECTDIDILLYRGFYPVVWNGENIAELFYPNYVRTYLDRDLRDMIGIKDLDAYQNFLVLTASRIGSVFKGSELSNEIGIAANTVNAWLSTLHASYIVFELKPFFTNTRKRLTKSSKVYFYDSGLASWLLGVDSPSQMNKDKMRGHLFENFIVCEVVKHFYNKGERAGIYFYRDASGVEVDLLIKNKDKYDLLEIKLSKTYHPEFLKGIKSFENSFPNLVAHKYVVYTGEDMGLTDGVEVVNFRTFLGGRLGCAKD